jgi:hypothetical protein
MSNDLTPLQNWAFTNWDKRPSASCPHRTWIPLDWFSLKSDHNNPYFTWRPFLVKPSWILLMRCFRPRRKKNLCTITFSPRKSHFVEKFGTTRQDKNYNMMHAPCMLDNHRRAGKHARRGIDSSCFYMATMLQYMHITRLVLVLQYTKMDVVFLMLPCQAQEWQLKRKVPLVWAHWAQMDILGTKCHKFSI